MTKYLCVLLMCVCGYGHAQAPVLSAQTVLGPAGLAQFSPLYQKALDVYFAAAAYMVFMLNIISTPWENIIPYRVINFKFRHLIVILILIRLMFWMLDFGCRECLWGKGRRRRGPGGCR